MLPDRFGYTLYENRQQEEPEIELWEGCKKPYDCGYYSYCSRQLP